MPSRIFKHFGNAVSVFFLPRQTFLFIWTKCLQNGTASGENVKVKNNKILDFIGNVFFLFSARLEEPDRKV